MERYPIPAAENRIELVIEKSRFIASLSPVLSVEQARFFIDRIKTEFSDASHHVPVFRIGFGSQVIEHCSDAGEPAGTAGRPALAVLQGSGLGDAAIVITRYFGGIKLGTGGLVRAYSDAVREVLLNIPLVTKIPTHTIMTVIPYSAYEQVKRLVHEYEGVVQDQDFGADVTLTFQMTTDHFPSFQNMYQELTRGQAPLEIIETNPNSFFPFIGPL